jgi:hypothetical protein
MSAFAIFRKGHVYDTRLDLDAAARHAPSRAPAAR